jgi:hypothetical protein
MVFDKPSCNNKEIPFYFLRKLCVEFILGHYVNYFDIGEFQGVGRGSMQGRENSRCDPLRGPHPPKKRHELLAKYLSISDNIFDAQILIYTLTHNLLHHSTFIVLSC